jgi:hypothetical protein
MHIFINFVYNIVRSQKVEDISRNKKFYVIIYTADKFNTK